MFLYTVRGVVRVPSGAYEGKVVRMSVDVQGEDEDDAAETGEIILGSVVDLHRVDVEDLTCRRKY